MKHLNCYNCKYFYVTWDPVVPRGCKAFGFKTKGFPSTEVYKVSGQECEFYFEKRRKNKQKNETYL